MSAQEVLEVRNYAIFGKKYARTEVTSRELNGAVFYVVSGHGGPDPGTYTVKNKQRISEDEYAYDIGLRLTKRLIERGALVYMIVRDTDGIRDERLLKMDKDERTYPNQKIPRNQLKRLRQRTDAINKLARKYKSRYQRAVLIHLDALPNRANIDVYFFHARQSKSGKALADRMKATFRKKYKKYQPGRGYRSSVRGKGFYVLRKTIPAAVLIELGNMKSIKDQRRFLDADNRAALANWLAESLVTDYKASKK